MSLGRPIGKAAHGCRDQGRPAAPADPDHTRDAPGLVLASEEAFQGFAHRSDGLPPLGRRQGRGSTDRRGMKASHCETVDVGVSEGSTQCPNIDGHERPRPRRGVARHERQLVPFGVHRGDCVN